MAEFSDASLTPRARRMAEWLCDITDPAQQRMFQDASVDLLLYELPDHWTEDDVRRASRDVRQVVGRKASRVAWLTEIGWLVGEREQLPQRPPQGMSYAAREAAQSHLTAILATLAAKVHSHRKGA